MTTTALIFVTVAMLASCKHCRVGEHSCPAPHHGPCPFEECNQ